MARYCRSCGTPRELHRVDDTYGPKFKLCPLRPLTKKERVARDLRPTRSDNPDRPEPGRLVVDRKLLAA
jgi:hypothetical protein